MVALTAPGLADLWLRSLGGRPGLAAEGMPMIKARLQKHAGTCDLNIVVVFRTKQYRTQVFGF